MEGNYGKKPEIYTVHGGRKLRKVQMKLYIDLLFKCSLRYYLFPSRIKSWEEEKEFEPKDYVDIVYL